MDKKERMVAILKNDYGISSMEELNRAIAKLGALDISIFCSEISTKGSRRYDQEAKAGA